MNKKSIAFIGFDLETLELLESNETYNIKGYFDFEKASYDDINYLGDDSQFENISSEIDEVVMTMDSSVLREKLYQIYKDKITSYVFHKSSNISKRADIGAGSVIQANTLVSTYSKIGLGCFINHNACIHHESTIGDFSIVAPSAVVLGRVEIGKKCYIGAGSIIKENVKIGSNVIIGAGSVVVNDIEDNSTVVGNPAKRYLL